MQSALILVILKLLKFNFKRKVRFLNQTINDLCERRSVRNYKTDQIDELLLDTGLKVGTFAPTGMNRQSPLIVAVQNKETIEKLRRMNAAILGKEDADPFYGAPTIIVVFADKNVNLESIKKLSHATEAAWQGILDKDVKAWGENTRICFEAQLEMFPHMITAAAKEVIKTYKDLAYGWKLTGAGGGGYLCLISDKEIPNAIQIRIRKK